VFRPDLIALWKAALDAQPRAGFVFNQYHYVRPAGQTQIDRAPLEDHPTRTRSLGTSSARSLRASGAR
jgi:hypothetical protein